MGVLDSASFVHQLDADAVMHSDWRTGSLRTKRYGVPRFPWTAPARRWRMSWTVASVAALIVLERDLRANASVPQIWVPPGSLQGTTVIYEEAAIHAVVNTRQDCTVEISIEETWNV